jgi:hypothetical protein
VNSAAGSALIAGILSGVFTMAGVLLGTRLQSRSADREQARAAAGQRDEILASLAGAVGSLEVQADLLHAKVWKFHLDRPLEVPGKRISRTGGPVDDERLARMEGDIERLFRDVISVVSEISVLCSRLEFAAPAIKPLGEGLAGTVTWLIEGVAAPDEEFRRRLGKVRTAFRAIDGKRDELAGEKPPAEG